MGSVVKAVTAKPIRDISRRNGGRSQSKTSSAASLISPHASLADLRRAASGCKACDLWKTGTQTVFGEGKPSAAVMMVGEQPGDQEDRTGRPFVGPAGRILDQALAEAGINRDEVYVTNVVKHFKWAAAERGKRRIHKKPRYSEIQACRPWLDAELDAVRPEVLVCLGASAAQALLGRDFRVTRDRGKLISSDLAPKVIATVHPSSILRARDHKSRVVQLEAFINDLKQVAGVMHGTPGRTERGRDKLRAFSSLSKSRLTMNDQQQKQQCSGVRDQDIRAALDQHWAASDANDFETEHRIYRDDAVLEYPQSSERIRGLRNIQMQRATQPSKKRFAVRRIIGRGNLWITEFILTYDGKPSFTVSIMEFEGDKVGRETQ